MFENIENFAKYIDNKIVNITKEFIIKNIEDHVKNNGLDINTIKCIEFIDEKCSVNIITLMVIFEDETNNFEVNVRL